MSSPKAKAKDLINEELSTFDVPASINTDDVPPSKSKTFHRVIKDIKSDRAFFQRLKESRKFWDLDNVSSLSEHACTSCSLAASVGWRATEILKELTHDVVNLVAYYHNCEDKSKEYKCKYCVDEFNGVETKEAEQYACPSECGCNDCDANKGRMPREKRSSSWYGRQKRKAYKKRNQRDHIDHLREEHEKELNIFLRFKQNVIPLCETGFWGFRNCDLADVLRHMSLNKGIKFLHMEEPPFLMSPRSPKVWQYMIGLENDDYDFCYQNSWDRYNEY